MKFKVGDKVRITGWVGNPMVGKVGIIYTMCPPEDDLVCVVRVGEGWSCAMKESEIESAVKAGEQLLLFEL